MIKIKLHGGESANLEPGTVETIRKGKTEKQAVIRIGTIDLVVMESAANLAARIKAAGGSPAWVEENPKAPKGEETLPPGGEGPGGMST